MALHTSSRRSSVPLHSASASRCSDFPNWVLLGTVAHMGRCRNNATTAVARTSAGCPIEVSFELADPPVLTRCIIDCPHLPRAKFFDEPPFVIGGDGAFLLISVIFPHRPGRSDLTDLFVYRSGPGAPSLELIPRPYPFGYQCNHIGVLSCGDHCLVLVHERRFDAGGRMGYVLHAFSTRTKSWSTKVARLAPGMEPSCGRFDPTKAFSVDGGSMAWVDLRYGILLFDSVAEDNPVVRLIQLPPLMPINMKLGVCFDGTPPCLDKIRDVTYSGGWFKFIEMGFLQSPLNYRWKAAMYKMKIHSYKWERCGTADSHELLPTDLCLPNLFPGTGDSEGKKLALNNLLSSYPTLDMYNDNIVYMMANVKANDTSGWVLAVNTKNKKLEKISSYSEESFHFLRIYRQSDFCNHIREAPGTHMTKDLGTCSNRQKIELLDINLLAALDLLRNIETYAQPHNRSNNSLAFSGSASSLDLNIQTEAEYDFNNGRSTVVSGHLRLFRDFELLLIIAEIKSKIRIAHGALYSLMETLPSDLLDNYFKE